MSISIRKAKIAKGGTLETSYVDDEGNEITLKGANVIHPDLREAFAGLKPFFADLTEQKEAVNIDWSLLDSEMNRTTLQYLEVTGISISEDVVEKCVITGRRTLQTSKVMNICAPATDLNSDTETYLRCGELYHAVHKVIFEVTAYIQEKKWMTKQSEIDFDGNEEDPFDGPHETDDVEPVTEVA